MATKVEVKTVPEAEDFTFEYTDDIDNIYKAARLMRMQLDAPDLALIEQVTVHFADGTMYILQSDFANGTSAGATNLFNPWPMDDMDRLIQTLSEIGIPYEAHYDANLVIINADASDKYVGVAFNDDGTYSFSN
jgi:hypothetical protein